MTIDLICLDADDTLWHNMRYFKAAERAFQAIVAPYTEPDAALARLHAVESGNLALYGYGAKSFTLSMIETASDLLGDRLPHIVISDLLAIGRGLLAHPVELFPQTITALDALAARARLVLITKGDLLHQEGKIAASGLAAHFTAIEIVSDKSAATFARVFARHGVAPERAVMAGDSMRSDILPALGAGAWAAHLPHDLGWHHEHAEAPRDHPRYRALASLAALPEWVDSLA